MKIIGIDDYTDEQISYYLNQGARFIAFEKLITGYSFPFLTVGIGLSDIYFSQPGERMISRPIFGTIWALLAGLVLLPYGPFYAIRILWVNMRGGRDVTMDLIEAMNRQYEEEWVPSEQLRMAKQRMKKEHKTAINRSTDGV